MDLRFSPEENAFREELRTFFREQGAGRDPHQGDGEPPPRQGGAGRRRTRSCTPRASTVPHWPKEWGGADWTPVQHYIYTEELQFNGVPQPLPFNVSMCGPVVIAFGTEEQKKRFLPRMAALDDWWCQGFSEPGAGSDLAGLKTTAVRQGDHYVVNGQKTWTTLAQYADWIFCLVPHRPGGQEAARHLLPADRHEDARASPCARSRPSTAAARSTRCSSTTSRCRSRTWSARRTAAGTAPSSCSATSAPASPASATPSSACSASRSWPASVMAGDRPLIEDERFREKVAAVEVELKALEMTQMRVLSEDRHRKDRLPNPTSSILKIKGSEIQQATTELLLEIAGPAGAALPARGRRRRVGSNEPPRRPRLGGTGGARLFQLPQGHDLRRLQRDPAQHPRQGGAGVLMKCVSTRQLGDDHGEPQLCLTRSTHHYD